MSYDFRMEIDTGGPEPHGIEPHFNDRHPRIDSDGFAGIAELVGDTAYRCGNYTYNVGEIIGKCLAAGGFDAGGLYEIQGRTGAELAPIFRKAVGWGVENIEELRKLNPKNGWGNADGAIVFLWDIQRMCEMHPKAKLVVT